MWTVYLKVMHVNNKYFQYVIVLWSYRRMFLSLELSVGVTCHDIGN